MASVTSCCICLLVYHFTCVLGQDFSFLEQVYGIVGSNVSIPCRVNSSGFDPSHTLVTWKKDNTFLLSARQIAGEEEMKLSYLDQSLAAGNKYEVLTTYSLVVSSLVLGDSDNYTCTVIVFTDDTQTAEKTRETNITSLLVQDVPTIPGRPIITDIESRSITVTWAHSHQENNSPIFSYVIQMKMATMDWLSAQEMSTAMSVKDPPACTFINLLPYTMYRARVIAVNYVGRSMPSQESEIFWTKSEAPSAAPEILEATSHNSSQIFFKWRPPPPSELNGELTGYVIQYNVEGLNILQTVTEENKDKTNLTIINLLPFTNYYITIRAQNNFGTGPFAEIMVRTAEGRPSKPRIIHTLDVMSTSFNLSWEAPNEMRGNLLGYELEWSHNKTIKSMIIRNLGDRGSTQHEAYISNLEPYTQYRVRVRAFTGGGNGEFSDSYPALTDVTGPGRPTGLNVTVTGSNSVFVQWEQPTKFYRVVNYYVIEYEDTTSFFHNSLTIEAPTQKLNITNLPSNRPYKLRLAAVTKSIVKQQRYSGQFTDWINFELIGDTQNETIEDCINNTTIKTDPAAMEEAEQEIMSAGIVAGIVCGLVFILMCILVFIGCRSLTCRKYYQAAFDYLAVPTNNNSPPTTVINIPEPLEEISYQPIPVADFLQHVRSLHADSDVGFSQEFADINKQTCGWTIRADASNQHENKSKNRYINIIAFDHSRVMLKPINGRLRSSDYINANYADGYKKPKAYIATQGPLPSTFADFWRMVWEQNSVVIVMITKLVERGKRKCDQYWPDDGIELYGPIQVKHLNTFSRAHYTVRMFSLKNTKLKKQYSERIVYHFHYTEWPDHGVPDFTLPVLKFVQKSAYINPPGAGPIVVHCSAGVGRTGTYILIDSMIEEMKDKGTINVAGFLLHIRRQRKFLVQTEEQYMLIHDAIAEYILSNDTEIKHGDLTGYIDKISQLHDGEKETALERQYKLVTAYKPKDTDKFPANKNINQNKNRNNDLVPLTVKRVPLPAKPGVDGSDYINATYLQGYNKTDEFILTQHPLEDTVEDFWRMVWDQNSSVVFLLSQLDDKEYKRFWPEKETPMAIGTGLFKVVFQEEEVLARYTVREFLLESTQDDYVLMTRILTCDGWPQKEQPLWKAFDMIETVKDLHKQNDIGPVIVVDRYGGVEGCVFCALWSLHDQQIHDKVVDTYHLCKLFHLKRPGIIGTLEDYLFLYKAMESYIQDCSEKESNNLSHHLHLRNSSKKNGTMPRSPTLSIKAETIV
ncbi:LOW QUALITY PROTEIN: tyrosine-protein phosphatase 99A-like [Pecten maximus]|uniref:LOW QUALITY PROTEIN: tyrosine-protein phosphatase 99A-like n=1 Tax=Pecten maximus TaxID=6579 RepID=UPI0014582EA4|nr:LOW QUALITY PROTEIN: tyrosine-protein phosphatase 99A-like [Pecten maximus]